jgi:hypothetical protein
MQLMLVGGVLLLIDTFLHWQEVSVRFGGFNASAGVSGWHGFWGVVMCLALIALLVWAVARVAGLRLPSMPISDTMIAAALAAIVLLFALIKNLADDYSTKWSYIGVVLAAVVAAGAWLEVQAAGGVETLRTEMSSMKSGRASASSEMPPAHTPPPAEPPPAEPPPAASGEPTT